MYHAKNVMEKRIMRCKMIDEKNEVFLIFEVIGEIVGISLMTRIDDDLIESGKKFLDEFFMIDPEIFDDYYEIKNKSFIYTIYINKICIDDKLIVYEIVSNHFYELLESIKKSKSKDIKELCYEAYKNIYIPESHLLIENELW